MAKARLTKTEIKRLYAAILSKTKKLWSAGFAGHTQLIRPIMSTPDMIAIEKIINKYQRKQ